MKVQTYKFFVVAGRRKHLIRNQASSCSVVVFTRKISNLVSNIEGTLRCDHRSVHFSSRKHIPSNVVHGLVLAKWLRMFYIDYSLENVTEVILSQLRKPRMQDVSQFINICLAIFIRVLNLHELSIVLDSDFQIRFRTLRDFFVGTYVHLQW